MCSGAIGRRRRKADEVREHALDVFDVVIEGGRVVIVVVVRSD